MGRIIKTTIFATLLIGSMVYFGFVCEWIGNITVSLSWDLLWLVLWLFLGLLLVAVTAGLVAALVRPLWLSIIVFALSALAMLIAWEFSLVSGILALVYIALTSFYAWQIKRELANRIKFSMGPISQNQSILLLVLLAVACTSLYFGFAAQMPEEGISIPPSVMEMIIDLVDGQLPPDMDPVERATILAEIENQLQLWVSTYIGPYQQYIPIAGAVAVFATLYTLTRLLSFIPTLLLRGIMPLLTVTGVIKRVPETVEAERLVL